MSEVFTGCMMAYSRKKVWLILITKLFPKKESLDKCLIYVFTNGFETLKNILAFLYIAVNGHNFIFANIDLSK